MAQSPCAPTWKHDKVAATGHAYADASVSRALESVARRLGVLVDLLHLLQPHTYKQIIARGAHVEHDASTARISGYCRHKQCCRVWKEAGPRCVKS